MARRGLVSEQLKAILDEAEENVETQSMDAYEMGANDATNLLHAKSPRMTGRYAAGWTYQAAPGKLKGYVVHNATDYQLTHLLEKGHALWQGGRVKAIPHIRPVEQATIAKVLERIERMKF